MKNPKYVRILTGILIFAVTCIGIFLYRAQQTSHPIFKTAFHLNTVITITIYDSQDSNLLDECMTLIQTYEQQFSRTIETSEISKFNQGILADEQGISRFSTETAELLEQGLFYASLSDGAFDPTIGSVSSVWDFTSEHPKVPDNSLIQERLKTVGYKNISLENEKITCTIEGVQLDLGAIAKGYIADCLKEYLISEGVTSATINLGGNVLCIGSKPDGSPFTIGIQKPFAGQNELAATVPVTDGSVVTSGTYERYFTQQGKLYHHILDPKTGYPCENELTSVTILSKTSVEGDGLSTTCFTLGLKKGMDLINKLPDTEALFITRDGTYHYSENYPQTQ